MNKVKFKPTEEFIDKANRIFEKQKEQLSSLLPYAEVHHTGSTAIPGSITKGDLDINIRVPEEKFVEACQSLEQLYATDPNNENSDTIAFFKLDSEELPVGIEVTVIGSEYDNFHTHTEAFLNDPKLVEEYNQLKLKFEGKDMVEYRKAKNKFFEKMKADQQRKIFIQIVKSKYPNVEKEQLKIFDDGWDFVVIVVNNETAFRFPRRQDYIEKLPIEVQFVNQFISNCPITIPKLELHREANLDLPYVTYPFIKGVQFKRDLATKFTKDELSVIAAELGKFLTVLHSFPLEKAEGLKKDDFDPLTEWRKRLEKIQHFVFPDISENEQQWIEKLFKNFFNILEKSAIHSCITHSDIAAEHIIVDPDSHKLAGVIDFGDVLIGDPAYDFTFLAKYGKDFLEKAYEAYKLPRDEYFEIRRRFYEQRVPITNLEHSILINDVEKLPIHKKQLSEYISKQSQ